MAPRQARTPTIGDAVMLRRHATAVNESARRFPCTSGRLAARATSLIILRGRVVRGDRPSGAQAVQDSRSDSHGRFFGRHTRTSRFTAGAGPLGRRRHHLNTQENGPSNIYNGFFSVESEYEFFLNGTLLGGFQLEKSQ
jgi:hypothetical protein